MDNQEIVCGCGFKVSGNNLVSMRDTYEDHNCPYTPKPSVLGEIFDAIFSFSGIVITLIIAGLIASINHVSL